MKALLGYRTANIGDDVQSLTLAQGHLFGEPDLWVDRDAFPDYADAGPIDLVANGFFICPDRTGALAFPPPPNFRVRYIALCASNLPDTRATWEHLRASAPIGCRDWHTLRLCRERGVEAYFASCPSCLLERDFDNNGDSGGEPGEYDPDGPIVLVDVNPKRLPPFGIPGRPFVCLTNRVRPEDYPDQAARFAALKWRLRVLRSAALVITNRLHVAMPCLGLGVPVVMVEADEIGFRLEALPPWLKVHRKEELEQITLDPARYHTGEWLENRASWREMVRGKMGELALS